MRSGEAGPPEFYFALPRLVAHLRARNAARTEKNWIEANIAGAAVMLVSYLAISRLWLSGFELWKQIALLLPAVVVTWIFWQLVLYIDAQIIKALRAAGFIRGLSNARAQSFFISTITTALAWYLLSGHAFLRAIGAAWIVAVCGNLLAATLLALDDRRSDATQ